MYEIYLERAAERDLNKLSPEVFHRVVTAIQSLSGDPRPSGSHKIVGSKKDWRIRVGQYRVIYEVDDQEKAVSIMRVRHRREVYR